MDYKEQEVLIQNWWHLNFKLFLFQFKADHPVMKEKRDKTLDKKNVFMKENKGHYRRVIHPTNK